MIVIIAFSLCFLLIVGTELIPYIYKLNMMGKVRIYKLDTGFAVKQFGYSTYHNIRYYYSSDNYYGWFWITRHKEPTSNPERLSQEEAEELAQSLHDDYLNYIVAEHKFYLETKAKEKLKKSAKLFKKL